MRISRKTRYGLLFLSKLKENYPNRLISLNSIAKEHGISPSFLKQIALDLKNSQIVTSKEGQGGGYSLAKDPKSISFKEILLSLEGPIEFPDCASEKIKGCPKQAYCTLARIYQRVYQSIEKEMEKINLGDLGDEKNLS